MGTLFSIMPAICSKIYGIKLSAEIYGFIYFAFGVSGLIGPFILFFTPPSDIRFLITYLIGSGCSLIAMIICFFLDTDVHVYK